MLWNTLKPTTLTSNSHCVYQCSSLNVYVPHTGMHSSNTTQSMETTLKDKVYCGNRYGSQPSCFFFFFFDYCSSEDEVLLQSSRFMGEDSSISNSTWKYRKFHLEGSFTFNNYSILSWKVFGISAFLYQRHRIVIKTSQGIRESLEA